MFREGIRTREITMVRFSTSSLFLRRNLELAVQTVSILSGAYAYCFFKSNIVEIRFLKPCHLFHSFSAWKRKPVIPKPAQLGGQFYRPRTRSSSINRAVYQSALSLARGGCLPVASQGSWRFGRATKAREEALRMHLRLAVIAGW